MEKEHVISDELFKEAQSAISLGRNCIAFNTMPYFLDKGDVYFFKTKEEANEFADNNISEFDNYLVFDATSIQEFMFQIPYGKLEENSLTNFLNKNLSTMNEKNYDYLKDQLKYTGFGEGLQKELKEKIEKQTPEFTLFHQQDFGKDNTVASLLFRKSNESDMYFFNRYDMLLKKDNSPDKMKQSFFINKKESNITLKEAYNLMNGRAVQKELATKEGQKYNAWLQLYFKTIDKNGNYEMKRFHENYGYNLEQTLDKLPLKELTIEADKTRLTESLQRGNRQTATLQQEGKEQKVFIEAAPQFKTLNIYDTNMQRINAQNLLEKKEEKQELKSSKKAAQKSSKGLKDEEEKPKQTKVKSSKKGLSIS
jgi:hypothetical protein